MCALVCVCSPGNKTDRPARGSPQLNLPGFLGKIEAKLLSSGADIKNLSTMNKCLYIRVNVCECVNVYV